MPTTVRSEMVDTELFYTKTEAYALFRSIFVGSYVDCAYEPGTSEPWLLPCFGQTLLVADYPALFDKIGALYGGNGTTTFGLPDWRGRVGAGKDNMGGTSANRLTLALNGDNLTAAGGAESVVLTAAQLASHDHSITIDGVGDHNHTVDGVNTSGSGSTGVVSGSAAGDTSAANPAGAHTHTADIGTAGGDQAHNNVQPTGIHVRCILAF